MHGKSLGLGMRMGTIGDAKARVIRNEIVGARPLIKGDEWIIRVQSGEVYLSVHPELFGPPITRRSDTPKHYDCRSDVALWEKRLDNPNLVERTKILTSFGATFCYRVIIVPRRPFNGTERVIPEGVYGRPDMRLRIAGSLNEVGGFAAEVIYV